MSEVKHTPGPWWVDEETNRPGIEAKDTTIVMWGTEKDPNDDGGIRGETTEQALANARLIAAAPELLEALYHMRYCAHCAQDAWEACDGGRAAIAAIAKATGGA